VEIWVPNRAAHARVPRQTAATAAADRWVASRSAIVVLAIVVALCA